MTRSALAVPRVTKAYNYRSRPGTLLDTPLSSSLTFVTTGSPVSTRADNTSVVFNGLSNSVKVTIPDGDTTSREAQITKSLGVQTSLTGQGTINFAIYIENQTVCNDLETGAASLGLRFVFYVSPNLTSTGAVLVSTLNEKRLGEGWNLITFDTSDMAVSQIGWFQIYSSHENGGPGRGMSWYYGGLWLGSRQRPKLAITFDDGYDDHYTEAYAYMQPLGLKGCCMINSDFVDTANYMTTAQLDTIYAAGWDIINHSATHDGMTLSADWDADVQTCKDFIASKGWNRAAHIFAPPGGTYTEAGTQICKDKGYTFIRGVDEQYANLSMGMVTQYNFPSKVLQSTITVATGKAYVDALITKGVSGSLYLHEIGGADAATRWTQAKFREMIDYIVLLRNRGLIDVVTLSELYANV